VGVPAARLGRVSCLAALLVAASVAGKPSTVADEHRVKAELVERFCRFIDWPERSLGGAERPFVIGILGTDEVGPVLEEVVRTRRIQGRPVEVRWLATPAGVQDCHVVWIARCSPDGLTAVLARTRGRPILTVADTPGFARAGVLINLVRKGNRVGFEINAAAAKASGLVFSSNLLRLSTIVDAEGGL